MVSRKQRKIDEYKRREAFKEPYKSVLIVCEGKKTEPIYFSLLKSNLRLAMVEVKIVGEGAAPINVVDRAIELIEERKLLVRERKSLTKVEYEVVYCVIDVEAPIPHESLARAIDKARGNKLDVILSNPCFEYWYVLHFRKTSAPFSSSRNVKSTLRQIHPAYSESDTTIFNVVYPKTSDAIKHSKEVLKEQHNNAEDLRNCNPSTHVHKIVEYLQNTA
ncbi:MAG: RloB domain-containing protein [Planctomycetes bacterium]|nr:RloB domain-containing protein [Planctomycetota bacterium]MBL7146717.1 RloB domain-containing protein [Phycisphaerae bacterium]